MRFMQTESVFKTKNRSGPAKNRVSVALMINMLAPPIFHHDHVTSQCFSSKLKSNKNDCFT